MKFGTSGLRGLSADLMGPASKLYAAAFGHYLLESGRATRGDAVLLGRDFRDSSPEIAKNCAAALGAVGFRIIDCGTLPTPALALYGLTKGAASLMVTGSHIPADRNGIKFYRPDGEIDKNDEAAINLLAEEMRATFGAEAGALANVEDHSSRCITLFLERNLSLLPTGSLDGLRIGVYQHSTVARDLLCDVLEHYQATVLPLGRSETFIPVDTEAVSPDTVASLTAWAQQHRLDAIVSADGDGDRPLVTDETGTPLRGDLLGLVAARFLGATTVVTPVTSNSGIEISGSFEVVRTCVGSPFVIAGMNEARAASKGRIIGFEANGGLLTASDFDINGTTLSALPTRDCFLPILAILSCAAERPTSLSEIAGSYRLPVTAADRLEKFPTEISTALMGHLSASDSNLSRFLATVGTVAASNDMDGLRIVLTNGRIIHFRPSGNAPEMRCYVEAETPAAASDLLATGLQLIRGWADSFSAAEQA